jgi:hypothetical protein
LTVHPIAAPAPDLAVKLSGLVPNLDAPLNNGKHGDAVISNNSAATVTGVTVDFDYSGLDADVITFDASGISTTEPTCKPGAPGHIECPAHDIAANDVVKLGYFLAVKDGASPQPGPVGTLKATVHHGGTDAKPADDTATGPVSVAKGGADLSGQPWNAKGALVDVDPSDNEFTQVIPIGDVLATSTPSHGASPTATTPAGGTGGNSAEGGSGSLPITGPGAATTAGAVLLASAPCPLATCPPSGTCTASRPATPSRRARFCGVFLAAPCTIVRNPQQPRGWCLVPDLQPFRDPAPFTRDPGLSVRWSSAPDGRGTGVRVQGVAGGSRRRRGRGWCGWGLGLGVPGK